MSIGCMSRDKEDVGYTKRSKTTTIWLKEVTEDMAKLGLITEHTKGKDI